jgi:hypothetical protein
MTFPENILDIQSVDSLTEALDEYQISTNGWGEGDTKTVEDLYGELDCGETVLFMAAEGLQKYITTIKANVFYRDESGLYRLVEAAQNNLITGTWRHRGLHNSLSEKRHAAHGETPLHAARRALREEIGVEQPLALVQTAEIVHPAKQERNYPSLLTINETQYFQASLRGEDYDPRGYIEEQPTKRTFFHWEQYRDEALIEIPLK